MVSNICFILAGILWAVELVPQLYKTIQTRKVEDFSIAYPLMCATAYLIFFVGCIIDKSWVLLGSHFLPFFFLLILLGLILKYRHNNK